MIWQVITFQIWYQKSIFFAVINKFHSRQKLCEWRTQNDEYENFVSNHIEVAECIPTKPTAS